jgi:aconitate hydratase 2/2-methylisocitrate dehydratase
MLSAYRIHAAERATLGIPPKPLSADEVAEVVAGLAGADRAAAALVELLRERVSPGVDDAAYVKAAFLAALARGEASCAALGPEMGVVLLGTMLGGYNVPALVALLDDPALGALAAEQLAGTLLVFDAFHDVAERARDGHGPAGALLDSWAEAEWFTRRPAVPEAIDLTVWRVDGEINTDDLSPAPQAWSRADVPLHALSLFEHRPDVPDPLGQIARLQEAGRPLALVGDVVGTGSSRKSSVNSLLWHIGHDVPYVPNKRRGGVVLAATIAPIFATTLEDAGAFALEGDGSGLRSGDHIVLRPHLGRVESASGALVTEFAARSVQALDAVRAGGRIQLIVGRTLTDKARAELRRGPSAAFRRPAAPPDRSAYTLAQKIVGRACGTRGVAPGTYCEPQVATVGSQDTTGPMNRNELEELACLGFTADLVLQTFCHTAAYPKPADIETQHTLPGFMTTRGGISLRPGDGIIHSWLNRMLLPDQVGTGSDSHTRFPLGISFPGGSGLVAFAAALGVMPIDLPDSVLVRFTGQLRPGLTLRDLVQAIPYLARQQGHLTVGGSDKVNVFNGRIIEIEGLEHLTVEQAFELSDSTAERSAAGCTVALSEASVAGYLRSNVVMLRSLIDAGYQDARTLARRAEAMERWLADPELLAADPGAEYAAVIEIDMGAITEPLVACPNDPDDIVPLSQVSGRAVDEVFIGSCMTNIGHFRAAGKVLAAGPVPVATRLWIAPPTRMDETQLRQEGYYSTFGLAGARTEKPGCSLCMGNQARVAPGATVFSTSTRNFPNRMGQDAQVFLGSAELAAVVAQTGGLPSVDEYFRQVAMIDTMTAEVYRYLEFDRSAESLLTVPERAPVRLAAARGA